MEKKTEQPVQAGEQHHGTVGKKDAGYAPERCGRFKKLLIPDDALILDTETTGIGIDDEVVELAILDLSGRCLYESLFHSRRRAAGSPVLTRRAGTCTINERGERL